MSPSNRANKVSKQELLRLHNEYGIAFPMYSSYNEPVGDLSGFTMINDCVSLDKIKLQQELEASGYNINQPDEFLEIFVKRAKQDLQKHAKALYPKMVGVMIYIDTPNPMAFPFFKDNANNDESPLASHHYHVNSEKKQTTEDSEKQPDKKHKDDDQRLQQVINLIQQHQRAVENDEEDRKKKKEKEEAERRQRQRRRRRRRQPSGPEPGE